MGGKGLAAFGAAIVVLGALMVATPRPVRAATTLIVDTFADSNTSTAVDCLTDVTGEHCPTLRDAVADNHEDGGGDVISLVAGTYKLTQCLGSNGGALRVDDSVTIQGAGSASTTIAGANCADILSITPWNDSLIDANSECVNLTVTGVTLTAGNASGTGNSGNVDGGAISKNTDCGSTQSLTMSDVDVLSNMANDNGGGVQVYGSSSVSLTNVTFAKNKAGTFDGGEGGGLYVYTSGEGSGPVSLNDVFVHDNTAGCQSLQGIGNAPKSLDNTICDSEQSGGGGVYIRDENSSTTAPNVTGNNLLISNNSTVNDEGNGFGGARGGGMYLDGVSTDILNAVTLNGNQATGPGGGVFLNFTDVSVSFTNVTSTANKADGQGGAFFLSGDSPHLNLLNATINGNTADAHTTTSTGGGAIGNDAGTNDVTVSQSILNGNRSGSGAALDECNEPVNPTVGDWNLSDDDTCDLDGTHDNNVTANVDLGALGANTWSGGPPTVGAAVDSTPLTTEALLTGSPAIDAIPAGTCPPPKPDERGVPRPQNASGLATVNCDIGAFEVLPAPAATPTPTSSVQALTTPVPSTGVSRSGAASGYVMLALGGALLIGGVASISRRRRRLG